jgi:hypothetical protein
VPPQVVLLCKDPGAKKYHAELAKVRARLRRLWGCCCQASRI